MQEWAAEHFKNSTFVKVPLGWGHFGAIAVPDIFDSLLEKLVKTRKRLDCEETYRGPDRTVESDP